MGKKIILVSILSSFLLTGLTGFVFASPWSSIIGGGGESSLGINGEGLPGIDRIYEGKKRSLPGIDGVGLPGIGGESGAGPGGGAEIENPLEYDTLAELVEAVINFIFWFSIPLTILFILVAGFLFISSGGEPEKIKTAKNTIMYTLIGFLIICSSKGIIAVIKKVLEVKSGSP